MRNSIKKVFRYISIYGVRRTLIKTAGRRRGSILKMFFPEIFVKYSRNISIIGCGQFGFSTISFFLMKNRFNRFLECFDIDEQKAVSASKFFGYKLAKNSSEVINNRQCDYIYIASNHFTHTLYAVEALKQGKIVYIEKPISVNWSQFRELLMSIQYTGNVPFVGYNRPFSPAIRSLSSLIRDTKLTFTLSCFITGHFIDKDHWYRKEEEGTRVCGNLGHWIDLASHLMFQRGLVPIVLYINVIYSSTAEMDDNITVTLTDDNGDLITITLTSRSEPFEGINETINFQNSDLIAKIDDFRGMTIWQGSKFINHKYWPKNVGHKNAILQPFNKGYLRNFSEIEYSTVIMLCITDMVRKFTSSQTIYPFDILTKLKTNEKLDETDYTVL